GVIGWHLCEALLVCWWSGICLGKSSSGRHRSFAGLLEHPDFRLVGGDVSAAPLSDDFRADRYFHLASPASPNPYTPRSYMAQPLETAMVNSIGLRHVLDLAHRHGGRALFASTSEIYGDPLEHP